MGGRKGSISFSRFTFSHKYNCLFIAIIDKEIEVCNETGSAISLGAEVIVSESAQLGSCKGIIIICASNCQL